MAQGGLKKITKPAASSKRSTGTLRKGARSFAPKKAQLAKQQKMLKKLTSGLTAKTERNLAERAGHLELLKGTKKDKGKDKATARK